MKQTIRQFLDSQEDGLFHYEGLSFAPVTWEHRPFLARAYENFATRHSVVPMMSCTPEGIDIKLNKFIAIGETGLGICAVFDDSINECIGFAGLSWMNDEHTKVEYNRVLLAEYKSRGYGTKILQALKVLAFEHLELDEFYGENLSYNLAAHKSQEDCGMEPDGHSMLGATIHGGGNYKDDYCTVYRMTKEQYHQKPGIKKTSGITHTYSRKREVVEEQTYAQVKALSKKPVLSDLERTQWIHGVQRLFLFNYEKRLNAAGKTYCADDPVERLNHSVSKLQLKLRKR